MRTITLTPQALEQLDDWKKSDPKTLAKIIFLLVETASNPFVVLASQSL